MSQHELRTSKPYRGPELLTATLTSAFRRGVKQKDVKFEAEILG